MKIKNVILLSALLFSLSLFSETKTGIDTGAGAGAGGGGGGGTDNGAIARNGSRQPTASIPWGGNSITNASSFGLSAGSSVDSTTFNSLPALRFNHGQAVTYTLGHAFGGSLMLKSSANFGALNIISGLDNGTQDAIFAAARKSNMSGPEIEYINFGFRANVDSYVIDVATFGPGAVKKPIRVSTGFGTDTPNAIFNIDGSVSITGGNLLSESGNTVTATSATGTTKTGPHLFIGTTAGTPTGVPALSPSGRVALNFDTTNNSLCAYDGGWLCSTMGGGVATHASSHIDGGSDAIDADKAEISFVPTNYVRTLTGETDSLDDLTSHLKGVDLSIGALAETALSGSATTTDGTATLIGGASFTVAEGETVLMDQKCSAVRTDGTAGSKGYAANFKAAFRRPAAGAATNIGTVVTVFEKADTPSAYSSQIDLTGNVVSPQVTGTAGQTVNWDCSVVLNRVI